MQHKPICPMMANMDMMPMMPMMPMMQMPMQGMNHGCMHAMPMDEDEKDEDYFAQMYGDTCHKMMPYVVQTIDKEEEKSEMLYEGYPSQDMINKMTDEAYRNMVKHMPEMADEGNEERQQFGRRRLARDLVGVLLLNELLRRRRRRRRPHGGYWGNDFGSPYNYNDYGYDYDYNDFYYNE